MAGNKRGNRGGGGNKPGNNGSVVAGSEPAANAGVASPGEPDGNHLNATGDDQPDRDGSDGNGADRNFVSPDSGSDSGADPGTSPVSATGKRRGRPPGTKNRASTTDTQTQKDLTKIVVGLHWALSRIVHVPELEIDAEEGQKITEASLRLAGLYNVPLPTETVLAWSNFGTALIEVYGPRVGVAMLRKKSHPAPPTPASVATQQPIPAPSGPRPATAKVIMPERAPWGNDAMWEPG